MSLYYIPLPLRGEGKRVVLKRSWVTWPIWEITMKNVYNIKRDDV
jgi:hypothetical protein